jgi:hypothetical protein
MIRDVHLQSRIQIFSMPDLGLKLYRIHDPDPQHWFFLICQKIIIIMYRNLIGRSTEKHETKKLCNKKKLFFFQ